MTLQEQYKKETGAPPWVYLEYKYGRKYTENYVEWLESKIKSFQKSIKKLKKIKEGVKDAIL